MYYLPVQEAMQVVFQAHLPLSHSQVKRIVKLCMAVILARTSCLSYLAAWLPQPRRHDHRIQWLERTLAAPYLDAGLAYEPFVKAALVGYKVPRLHVVMDRTCIHEGTLDMVCLSLSFRRRTIPLVWETLPHGSSDFELHKRLIERVKPLLPSPRKIVFHGDNEFGGVPLLCYLRDHRWDFIAGQSAKHCYQFTPDSPWQRLGDLLVSRHQPAYLSQILLTKAHQFGDVNLFAVYQPRFKKSRPQRRQDVSYYATSLPITPHLRQLGKRRWGIECSFKDFKSAGWQLHHSDLHHPARQAGLLTILNLTYLWLTCLGRWLCKTGQRSVIDKKPTRHYSFFRLGWLWIANQYRTGGVCPALSTLYS